MNILGEAVVDVPLGNVLALLTKCQNKQSLDNCVKLGCGQYYQPG
jgi:hypothetical protein